MRIARFTTDDDPRFGLIGDEDGTPTVAVVSGDPLYAGIQLTGEKIPLDDVRLLAPVIPRSKVIGIGRNYAAHAAELGNEVPDEPVVFLKPNTSVVGPGDPVVIPAGSTNVHYEGELAVVIGRICRDVPVADALKVVHGYTVANDVTERDLQGSDAQWTRAKGYDTFCPLGPWIETRLDLSDLRIRTQIGDRVVQDGTTADLVRPVPDLIAYVSSFMTLLPGDVILTGTPEGVGPMSPGDEVAITVDGIGTLTNRAVAADA